MYDSKRGTLVKSVHVTVALLVRSTVRSVDVQDLQSVVVLHGPTRNIIFCFTRSGLRIVIGLSLSNLSLGGRLSTKYKRVLPRVTCSSAGNKMASAKAPAGKQKRQKVDLRKGRRSC